MEIDTFETIIDVHKNRRPFRPFVIELDSGSEVTVRHPEFLLLQRGEASEDEGAEERVVICYFRPFDDGAHMFEASAVSQVRDETPDRLAAAKN